MARRSRTAEDYLRLATSIENILEQLEIEPEEGETAEDYLERLSMALADAEPRLFSAGVSARSPSGRGSLLDSILIKHGVPVREGVIAYGTNEEGFDISYQSDARRRPSQQGKVRRVREIRFDSNGRRRDEKGRFV